MKRLVPALLLATMLVLCSCAPKYVIDKVVDIVQKEDEHILGVKGGSPNAYPDKTYGDCFEGFFGNPTWKYFVGTKEGPDDNGDGKPDYTEDNVDVVEFTGDCVYQDVEVKALIQFTLNKDNTFEATYLSFNDVPQNLFMLSALLDKVFDGERDDSSAAGILDIPANTQDSGASDENNSDLFVSSYDYSSSITEYSIRNGLNIPYDAKIKVTKVGSQMIGGGQYQCDILNIEGLDEYSEYYATGYFDVDTGDVAIGDDWTTEYYDGDIGDFVLPKSSDVYLTEADLAHLDADLCRIARNEIYARHGRRFVSNELQSYFDSQDWYEGLYSPEEFDESVLSPVEKQNLITISDYENKLNEEESMGQEGDMSLYGVVVDATDGYVNLRSGAGTNHRILLEVPDGKVMAVYEESSDRKWLKVIYDKTQGWVAASQVRKQ